jgi:hypothetical protein
MNEEEYRPVRLVMVFDTEWDMESITKVRELLDQGEVVQTRTPEGTRLIAVEDRP